MPFHSNALLSSNISSALFTKFIVRWVKVKDDMWDKSEHIGKYVNDFFRIYFQPSMKTNNNFPDYRMLFISAP
jgi:hypothetical protein